MELIIQLFRDLWTQNFDIINNHSISNVIYFILFIILFLENGILPAAFLPGDSLLILVGVLCTKGTLNFFYTLIILTIAASLGCWISYIQGRWLSNTRVVQNWLIHLPVYYHRRAYLLLHKHGLYAILIGRFISFIRTLLPIIAGLSGLSNIRFQLFNWISALLWVFILMTVSCLLCKTSYFIKYEDKVIFFLILLPIILLLLGLAGSVIIFWKKINSKS